MNDKKNQTEFITFKIIVIGDCGTGKSSFIQRFVFDKFKDSYKATIGVDYVSRTIRFEENTLVKVQLWDLAGQERFGGMTRVYYKDSVGCLILFDLSNYRSFESVKKWKDDIDGKVRLADGSILPCVLVGNKNDLHQDPRITSTSINELIKTENISSFCRVSTKLNQNVNESVNILIADIISTLKLGQSNKNISKDFPDSSAIKLDNKIKKSKCC